MWWLLKEPFCCYLQCRLALKRAVVNPQMHGLLAELPMAQPSVNVWCKLCTSQPWLFHAKIALSCREAHPSFVGLTLMQRKCLSSSQISTMGIADKQVWALWGVFHQLIPLRSMKPCARRLVCLGSLSCWKRWPWGNRDLTKGRRVFSKISLM